MPTVKELREEFAKTRTEAQKLIDDAIAAGKDLTAEEQEANAKRFSRLEQIKKTIDDHGKFAKLAIEEGTATGPAEPAGKQELEAAAAASQAIASGKLDRAEFSRAVARWCATGSLDAKFATITTATQSGIFLPTEVVQPLVPIAPNTFRQAFGIWGMPVMSTPTTAKIDVPILTATAGGAVAENSTTETENEPGTAGSIVSQPKAYESGTSWFSNLQISAVDWDLISAFTPAWLQNKELGLEAAIAAGIIADAGITQVVTTAAPTALSVDDLAGLDQELPKRYQYGKVIVLSQSAYAAACALRFSSGGFALTTDANGLRRFQGTPVLRCDNFQALAATNKIGCVLSLSGFHLRDAGQTKIIRYVQVPSKPDQSGFDLVSYHGFGWDPNAVSMLEAHA